MSEMANPMSQPRITKIVVNIGVGEGGDRLSNAEEVLRLAVSAKCSKTCLSCALPTDVPVGLLGEQMNTKFTLF